MRRLFAVLLALTPLPAAADMVTQVIVPAHDAFATRTADLATQVDALCAGRGDLDTTRAAFADAWRAWAAVQPITFGPVTEANRGYRIQFWPDRRNVIGRHLAQLRQAPDLLTPDSFAGASVAVQGLPALERLLHPAPPTGIDCTIAAAIADNLATIAAAMAAEWRAGPPLADDPRTLATQAVTHGVEAIKDARLAPALGTLATDAHPRALEAWRAGLSADLARAAFATLDDLYRVAMAPDLPADLADQTTAAFDSTGQRLDRLPSPLGPALADPGRRIVVEDVVTRLDSLHTLLATRVAPALGVTIGFNSRDGD